MENFDRENIDELLEIRQYLPRQILHRMVFMHINVVDFKYQLSHTKNGAVINVRSEIKDLNANFSMMRP